MCLRAAGANQGLVQFTVTVVETVSPGAPLPPVAVNVTRYTPGLVT